MSNLNTDDVIRLATAIFEKTPQGQIARRKSLIAVAGLSGISAVGYGIYYAWKKGMFNDIIGNFDEFREEVSDLLIKGEGQISNVIELIQDKFTGIWEVMQDSVENSPVSQLENKMKNEVPLPVIPTINIDDILSKLNFNLFPSSRSSSSKKSNRSKDLVKTVESTVSKAKKSISKAFGF
jgi:hypothetical protein